MSRPGLPNSPAVPFQTFNTALKGDYFMLRLDLPGNESMGVISDKAPKPNTEQPYRPPQRVPRL